MPYVRTPDRIRIYYEEHGPTATRVTGSPVVLAYGIGGNADLWESLQQWRVPTREIVPDRAGNTAPIPMGYADGLGDLPKRDIAD